MQNPMVNDGGSKNGTCQQGSTTPILDGEAMGFMQKEMTAMLGVHKTRISAWKSTGRAPKAQMKELRDRLDAVVRGKQPPPAAHDTFRWWKQDKENMGNQIDKLLERGESVGLTLEQIAKAGAVLPRTIRMWRRNSRRIHRDAFKRMETYVDEAIRGRNIQNKAAVDEPTEVPSNGSSAPAYATPSTAAHHTATKLVHHMDLTPPKPAPVEVPEKPQPQPEPAPTPPPEPKPEIVPKPAPRPPTDVALYLVKCRDLQVAADTLAAAVDQIIRKLKGDDCSATEAEEVFGELEYGTLGYSVTAVNWKPVDRELRIKTSWILEVNA